MRAPKCDDLDYIQFLVASPRRVSAVEAAKSHPATLNAPAHDAFTRLLHRTCSDGASLWREAKPFVDRRRGVLVVDDSTLDKPCATRMALVSQHWSGKHQHVVWGIPLLTLLWTDGDARIPCDCRIYDPQGDGKSKQEHFAEVLRTARMRGSQPEWVAFDTWYASVDNLRLVRRLGWRWFTRVRPNRLVNPDGADSAGYVPLGQVPLGYDGRRVWLKGYGWVVAFRTIDADGKEQHWLTSLEHLDGAGRAEAEGYGRQIEVYHRGLKQTTGIEACQARCGVAQRNHLGLALRAFLRLEVHRLRTAVSWTEAKAALIREAVRAYLAEPRYLLALSPAPGLGRLA